MKAKLALLVILSGTAALNGLAQTFSSGSDGSYGAINLTQDAILDVPPNGIFNCTTINVAGNRVLRFRRNVANTPVYLLASGNVTIAGTIDITGAQGNNALGGLAGPGGFDGGSPGSLTAPPGAGYGPGAGNGGTPSVNADGAGGGSYASIGQAGASTNKGASYGNALIIPAIGGSGGGGTSGTPGAGGGGGGGSVLIASSTRIDMTGQINARGGSASGGSNNGGSGGAIRLVAPVVAGGGTLDVTAQTGSGFGRIRIDALDRTQMGFNLQSAAVTSVGSLLIVFPNPIPRLDIIEAAGSTIPVGSGPVILLLPFGSSPNRSIIVQARDFASAVPITVVLTPDHGAPVTYRTTLENRTVNPATASVDVVLPVNEQVTVNVFSK